MDSRRSIFIMGSYNMKEIGSMDNVQDMVSHFIHKSKNIIKDFGMVTKSMEKEGCITGMG